MRMINSGGQEEEVGLRLWGSSLTENYQLYVPLFRAAPLELKWRLRSNMLTVGFQNVASLFGCKHAINSHLLNPASHPAIKVCRYRTRR